MKWIKIKLKIQFIRKMFSLRSLQFCRNLETLPTFKRQLKDVRCCDGDSVRLECHVEAAPEPTIIWEKDGRKLLQSSDDFSTSFDGGRAILTIKRVYPEDEGEYKCIASNSIGKSVSSACIIVDGMSLKYKLKMIHSIKILNCLFKNLMSFSGRGERKPIKPSIDTTKWSTISEFNATFNAPSNAHPKYVTDDDVVSVNEHQCHTAATQ